MGYDAHAEWYDALVGLEGLPVQRYIATPALLELAGEVRGRRVLDLGCGQGYMARVLAEAGADVVGIDISEALVERARRYETEKPLGIVYRTDDARALASVGDAEFDLVVCNLSLMDMPELPRVFGSVRRVLRDGGRFVFTITHPCFQMPGAAWNLDERGRPLFKRVDRYFEEQYWQGASEGGRERPGAFHRTLETYVANLLAAGFTLEALREPKPVAAAYRDASFDARTYARVPAVLAISAATGTRGA